MMAGDEKDQSGDAPQCAGDARAHGPDYCGAMHVFNLESRRPALQIKHEAPALKESDAGKPSQDDAGGPLADQKGGQHQGPRHIA